MKLKVMMKGRKDEWVFEAINNDSIVAQSLLNLKHANSMSFNMPLRQPRSEQMLPPCTNINNEADDSLTLPCPSTPLSQSGPMAAAAVGMFGPFVASGAATRLTTISGGDGSEYTTEQQQFNGIIAADKTAAPKGGSEITGAKKGNQTKEKKETLAELRGTEIKLSKQNSHLKREIRKAQVNCWKLKAKNDRIKSLLLIREVESVKTPFSTDVSRESLEIESGIGVIARTHELLPSVGMSTSLGPVAPPPTAAPEQTGGQKRKRSFDLNIFPEAEKEEESS